MGGPDESVSRREFDLYRDAVDRRITRLEIDLDAADRRHLEDMRALENRREDDQRQAREHAEQRREWTWGRVTGILAALAALAALAVDTLSKHQ